MELQNEHSSVILQSGLDEQWWAETVECYCFFAMPKISYQNGQLHVNGDVENNPTPTTIYWHLEKKACEDPQWNDCASTPHRLEEQ